MEGSSTIASMIERFRSGTPTDPEARRKRREAAEERGRVDARQKFWWMEESEKEKALQAKIEQAGMSSSDDDERRDYTWAHPAPLSPRRRSRRAQEQRDIPSLDQLIAQDVEEFATSARLSHELRARQSRELEFDPASPLSDGSSGGSPKQDYINVSPLESTTSRSFDRYVVVQEKADVSPHDEDPVSLVFSDSKRTQQALQKAKAKLAELDRKARLEEEETKPLSIPASSSLSQVVQKIETDLYKLELPVKDALASELEATKATTLGVVESKESMLKPSEVVAEQIHRHQEEIKAIARKARERALEIEEQLLLPSKPLKYDFNRHAEDDNSSVGYSGTDEYYEQYASRYGENVAGQPRVSFDIHDHERPRFVDSRYRTRLAEDPIYGRPIKTLDIAEKLDAAMVVLSNRLGTNEKPTPVQVEGERIERLKRLVSERIREVTQGPEDESTLPPLPSDFEAGLDLLTARLAATKAPVKPVPLRQVNPDMLGPRHRALYNAFHARDWDEDGLVSAKDAVIIIKQLASWARDDKNGLNISEEDVLIASGLLVGGPHASRHLTFEDLSRAFDAILGPESNEQAQTGWQSPTNASKDRIVNVKYRRPKQRRSRRRMEKEEEKWDKEAEEEGFDETASWDSSIGSFGSEQKLSPSSSPRSPAPSRKVRKHTDENKVYADEIRRIAQQLRDAQANLENNVTAKPVPVVDQTEEKRYPGAPGTRTFEPREDIREDDTVRPPPFNPSKVYFPSAPEFNTHDASIRKDQIVLNVADLQSAVQLATIEYYKRHGGPKVSSRDLPPSDVNPGKPSGATQREELDSATDKSFASDAPLLTFDYHNDAARGYGKLRVRGLSQAEEPVIPLPRVAAPQETAPIENTQPQPAAPTDHSSPFAAHNAMIDQAWTRLNEYQTLRKSLTRSAAF